MRIGIIGLGSIACKAYLPVITEVEHIELVFCTRNREKLEQLANKYRVKETVESVEELIQAGVDAAFIHTSTDSHVEIAEQLIKNGIHVFVDKPISYHYEESKRIVELAEEYGVTLMVGFNRRFAPMYAAMKEKDDLRLVHLQKNRMASPDFARRFVLDDFIHVVDTIRFLAPGEIKETSVSSYIQEGKLHYVMLQLQGDGFTFTGLMNRDSGTNEETLEVMNPGNKWVIEGLNREAHFIGGAEGRLTFKDWDPVLYRRGFEQMITHFISCIRDNTQPMISARDALESHRLCEYVVQKVEEKGALVWGD
ncbi:Gfo/Idh/MocA family oxidoreductase [Paenibacillus anaericanus]|uniref:Gfo/Idh/MocA family oxidoreductase n=1 Tax=Paenibacillus anaericanus TaxID=170367 RepID=A0A3S1DXN0_9BACL|nr:Gfo/Idh/MocA family oxidoreductase [Paenibacillus anaericanus]RUT47518.1 Gfo/Idh/MocA family oxidoreductase [Paenibacillus anaericanus]